MPWSGELKLKTFIEAMRAQKLPIFKETVMTYANRMLEGTVHATAFKDGKVDRYCYNRFLKRHDMHTRNKRPLEIRKV